ncbi:MAG: hypothetical protein VW442_03090 [Acidimicrobiaceae bacterium]
MSLFSSARRRLGWVALGACCAATVGIAELHTARAASSSTPSSFVAIEPIRVLDTRVTDTRVTDRTGLIEMRLTERIALPSGRIVDVVPASATAVSLNVTAVDGIDRNGFGFVTVHPCDVTTPDTSNLNFRTGQTVPNAVVAPLSPDGRVCFAVYGSAHLLADLNGYFVPVSAGEQSASPTSRYSNGDIDNLLNDKADADVVAAISALLDDKADTETVTSISETLDDVIADTATGERVGAVETNLSALSNAVTGLGTVVETWESTVNELDAAVNSVESTLNEHSARLDQATASTSPPHRVTTPPSSHIGDVIAAHTDIALRLSGLPIIAVGTAGGDLVIIDCADHVCSSSSLMTVSDANGDGIGGHPSIVIGVDGNPVIAHRNTTDSDLVITACADDACETSTTTSIDTPELDGITPDLTIGQSGFPVIAHQAHDADNLPKVGQLRVLTCNDSLCAGTGTLSPTHSTVDGGDASSQVAAGFMPSLTIGVDGFPVLAQQVRTHSGENVTATELQLISCDDVACVGGDEHVVVLRSSEGSDVGWNPTVVTTAGGTSLVAHLDGATLLVTECQNTNCFARDTSTVASNGVPTSGSLDLQLGTAGQAIIVYTTTDDDIGIGLCHQSGCGTSAVATTIDTNDIDGVSPRFTIDSIGRPIVTSTTLIGDLRLNIPWWVTP